jgi:cytochrome c oxidase assembly factor CtaG
VIAASATVPSWLLLPQVLSAGDSAHARMLGEAFGVIVAPPPPSLSTLFTGWSFDVEVLLPLLLTAGFYLAAVRKVNREHPANPVPRKRPIYWLAGIGMIILATESPIGFYDTTLFSDHMIQHLLLTMVAAPLLVLGAPITLLLRVSTPEARKQWILPFLHSRLVRTLSFPPVAWVTFTGFMIFSHFSPLFEAALENPSIHLLEHVLYVGTAMLFWWPVIAADPSPWRMPHAGRVLYIGLGMPWSSFLGLAIFSANGLLYPWYGQVVRNWGMPPLEDQAWAGGIMWAGGDGLFLIAIILALAAWLRFEEQEGKRIDAQLDRQQAMADRRRAALAAGTVEEQPSH